MKRITIMLIAISAILFSTMSCDKADYSFEKELEIVNNSSSRVAGSIFMGMSTFDLAPGETFSTSLTSKDEKRPDISQVTETGPNDLTIDGKRYTLKATAPANGFFELYGWDVTENGKGFSLKMELTDEGLARILTYADLAD